MHIQALRREERRETEFACGKKKGLCNNLVNELSIENTTGYNEIMRMSHEDLLTIFGHIEQDIMPHQVIGRHCVINLK